MSNWCQNVVHCVIPVVYSCHASLPVNAPSCATPPNLNLTCAISLPLCKPYLFCSLEASEPHFSADIACFVLFSQLGCAISSLHCQFCQFSRVIVLQVFAVCHHVIKLKGLLKCQKTLSESLPAFMLQTKINPRKLTDVLSSLVETRRILCENKN